MLKKTLDVIRTAIGEFFSTLLAFGLFFVDLEKRNLKTAETSTRPILFIHGYLFSSGGWLYYRYRFLKAGRRNLFFINLGSPFSSIDDHAKKVKQMADQIVKTTGRKDLILVGQSMGGLAAIHYANTYAMPNTVTDIITLGSSLEGTKMAILGVGLCVKEMRIGSSFLAQLSAHRSTARFFHIASQTDPIIIPWQSALFLSNKAEIIDRFTFSSMGHLQYYFSPKAASLVIKYISNYTERESV